MQIAAATLLGMGLAWMLGWGWGAGLVFGLALSVASTVVLLRALEERQLLDSRRGKIAVGWLIVEDLVMVMALVLLPALSGLLGGTPQGDSTDSSIAVQLLITLGKVMAFIVLMVIVGRRVIPWLLERSAGTGSRELFTLAVLAIAMGIAYGSAQLFGVSFALGAFFAGMILNESEYSHKAAEDSLPLRDAFAVLFFVSVGMLFDPSVLVDRPLQVLAVVLVIVLGKSLAACALVLVFRYPLATALTVSASLAQIGEFSFILAGLGVMLGLLPVEGQSLVLAGALISIATNPLWFSLIAPLQKWLHAHSKFARELDARSDPLAELPMTTEAKYLSRQVVLVGYGRVGRRIAAELETNDIPYVVAEQNRELVEKLREAGIPAVWGDAADPAVLIQAHVARARVLVVATPDAMNVRQMIETARTLNPTIQTVVRSHNEQEARLLAAETDAKVFLGEQELAQAMARDVVQRAAAMAVPV
ncbi:putative cation/proton antiporter YbaL [compost metagenome]